MTARQKVAFVIQRLSESAKDLAVAVWRAGGDISHDYERFIQEFQDVFDHPDQGHSGEQRLLRL